MKKIIPTLLLLATLIDSHAQPVSFWIQATTNNPIAQSHLKYIQQLSDLQEGFPTQCIENCKGVEVVATCSGTIEHAKSTDAVLSAEQKHILRTADIGSKIEVRVKYEYKNPVTENTELHEVNYTATVVPDTQAQYTYSEEQLSEYMQENVLSKIPASHQEKFPPAAIQFTISEGGTITQFAILNTSGDDALDQMLLAALQHMPNWKPARNAQGETVPQQFTFNVGIQGC